jgi:hypothetical protein
MPAHIVTCSSDYRRGFGFDGWIYCTLYIHTARDYRQYSAIATLHTFQFTDAHVLGLSVFTSRILATGLSQSHCNLKSHAKSSSYSLIPFLPFLLSHLRLTSPELDLILFLLDYCSLLRLLLLSAETSYNHFARTPRKIQSSIVKNACLLVRYIGMDVLLLSRARVLRKCVYRPVA